MDREILVFKAISVLREKHPHIYITLDITDVEVIESSSPMATCSYDTESLRYKIEVSDTATDSLDKENLAAVIHNAVLHIIYGNVLEDIHSYNYPELAVMVQEAIVNDDIKLFKEYKNDLALGIPILIEHLNPKMNSKNHTTSDIYSYLESIWQSNNIPPLLKQIADAIKEMLEEEEEDSGNGGSGEGDNEENDGDGEGESSENPNPKKEDSDNKNTPRPMTNPKKFGKDGKKNAEGKANKLSDLEKDMAQALMDSHITSNSGQYAGLGSANLDRSLERMRRAEYDFKQLFEMAVRSSILEGKKATWMRPNRRYGRKAKGYVKKPKPKVLVLTDTSGSISQEVIEIVSWQVQYLSEEYDFHFCWGDTELQGMVKVENGEVPPFKFTGYGGTELNFFQELEEEHQYDLIIFNTDGYLFTPIKETPAQKIFCIYPGGREIPGYLNIRIKPE